MFHTLSMPQSEAFSYIHPPIRVCLFVAPPEGMRYYGIMGFFSIRKSAENYIRVFDPKADSAKALSLFSHQIQQLEADYSDLVSIGQQREKYNVSWAFSHAKGKLQHDIMSIFTDEVRSLVLSYTESHKNRQDRDRILTKFSVIEEHIASSLNKSSRAALSSRSATIAVTLTEFGLSFLIVILIAQVSQMIDRAVSIPQLSLLFIGIFGTLRMLLEKVKQRSLLVFRWNMFQDSIDSSFNTMAILTAVSCLILHYMKSGSFLYSIDDLLEKAATALEEKPDTKTAKERRASHTVARRRQLISERIRELQLQMDKELVKKALDLQNDATFSQRVRKSGKSLLERLWKKGSPVPHKPLD